MTEISKENSKLGSPIKKIFPIKSPVVHLDENNVRAHLIKRKQGRVLGFTPESYSHCGSFKNIFFRDLKLQKKMQKLSIEWVPHEPRFHSLIGVLGQPDSLQSLSLNFPSFWYQITDAQVDCMVKNLRKLTSLKRFSFCSNTSSIGLDSVRQIIRKLSSLQDLSVNMFGYLNITDAKLSSFCQRVKNLTKLQGLSLKICDSAVTDVGIENLRRSLKKLTDLNSLSFNFSRNAKITDTGLSYLQQILQDHADSLTRVSLNLSSRTKAGLNSFISCIQNIHLLQSLDLSFENPDKISDAELNNLGKALQKLSSLEQISLDFSRCKFITDDGVKDFSQGLEKLTSLRNLSVDFSLCHKITKAGFNYLRESLESLTGLQNIELDFSSCTDKSISLDYFRNSLKELASLKSISLALPNFAESGSRVENWTA